MIVTIPVVKVLETESNDAALCTAIDGLTSWVRKFRENAAGGPLADFLPKVDDV